MADDDPLWDAPNIYISPHCSTSQDRYTDKLFALFADNLGRYTRGRGAAQRRRPRRGLLSDRRHAYARRRGRPRALAVEPRWCRLRLVHAGPGARRGPRTGATATRASTLWCSCRRTGRTPTTTPTSSTRRGARSHEAREHRDHRRRGTRRGVARCALADVPASPASDCSRSPIPRGHSRSGSTIPSVPGVGDVRRARPAHRRLHAPANFPRLRRVLEQFPDQAVVLDHCGFADVSGGPPYANAGELFACAAYPNLHLKVTSGVLESAEQAGRATRATSSIAWPRSSASGAWCRGTDYPQTPDRPYADLVALGRRRARRGSRPRCRSRARRHRESGCWPEIRRERRVCCPMTSWISGALIKIRKRAAFDVFDVHHHVGRAFDALGGDARRPAAPTRTSSSASSSRIAFASWTRAASTRRS